MRLVRRNYLKSPIKFFWIGTLIVLVGLAAVLVSCGGYGSSMYTTGGTGTINVSMTDPPSCLGTFDHVWITVRSVQANISATADDNSSGWQELVPGLNTQPKQIDLFAAGSTACVLTMLGSNTALPAGTYQQIRLLLLANDASSGPVPSPNNCAGAGFNCVFLKGSSAPTEIDLSSQANTGLKIPPGQVMGGPITVAAGKDVDLNIDFNACASIIREGNGQFRLKPVLTAGQVSTNSTGISGQVVGAGSNPINGGIVLVALEQQDSSKTDVIYQQEVADSNGNFNFCPLPSGAMFDVVVVAIDGTGVAYNATVAAGVPGGTNLGKIPLVKETGTSTGPTMFQGFVTAKTGTMTAAKIDASVSAIQTISLGGSVTRDVTIPAEGASVANLDVSSNATCPGGLPLNANCDQYTLIEPASNPSVGIFTNGTISYLPPAAAPVPYKVRASAAVPLIGGTDCTPSSQTATQDASSNPLNAVAGTTVQVKEIDFTGCS